MILGAAHLMPAPRPPERVAVASKRVTKLAGARAVRPPAALHIHTAPAVMRKSHDRASHDREDPKSPPSSSSADRPSASPLAHLIAVSPTSPASPVHSSIDTATTPRILVSPPSLSARLPPVPDARVLPTRPRSWGSDKFSPQQPSPLRRMVSYEEPPTPTTPDEPTVRPSAPVRRQTLPAGKARRAKDRHTISAEIAQAAWGASAS